MTEKNIKNIINRLQTKAVHAGSEPDKLTGAVIRPIFQTSTFEQSEPGVHKGYDYSRADNPTRESLEVALAALEGAEYGLSFSSGLACEQAVIQILEPNAKILVCDDVYGGTGRLFRKIFAKHGLDFVFLDMCDPKFLESGIDESVDMVWVETPSNPTMKVVDIDTLSKRCQRVGAKLVVDNTFATPVFQNPLSLGADIVVHSTTKYIGGHSDVIGGALMTNDKALFEQLKFVQFAAGSVPSPFECFLLHRSIKTLPIRMQRHAENATAVAEFLENHPKVAGVYYPGLKSHPQHEVAKRQMAGFSGMVSADLKGSYGEVVSFLEKLKVFTLAESLGGVESLVNHPEKMTHASVPEKLRKQLGIGPNLVRLSVGIEGTQDILDDLAQALV